MVSLILLVEVGRPEENSLADVTDAKDREIEWFLGP